MPESRQLPDDDGSSPSSRKLHAAAMKAFAAAEDIARTHPQPGSDERREWVRLSNQARRLNDAFLAALAAEHTLPGEAC
jgi:hypothetical protein